MPTPSLPLVYLLALCAGFMLVPLERSFAADASVVEAVYTADALRNVSGGVQNGGAVLQNVDLAVELDLDEIVTGIPGTLFTYLLWNDDATFSDRYTGDFQGLSNIDTEGALRLYEFWYESHLSAALNFRFGLYDLNSEFDVIDSSRPFINSSHGIGAEFAQSGRNGPSIFPVTSLAMRLHWDVGDRTTIRYALLDGVPGDPDQPDATTVRLGGTDGLLHVLEVNRRFANSVRLGLGAWRYSSAFGHLRQPPQGDTPSSNDNQGIYAFSEVTLTGHGDDEAQVDLFLRYGIANEDMNVLDRYAGAGILVSNLFESRPGDSFGLAVARAHAGTPWVDLSGAPARHETSIEATYSLELSDWLRLQPSVQYILNPSFGLTASHAVVAGLRIEAGWSGPLRRILSR